MPSRPSEIYPRTKDSQHKPARPNNNHSRHHGRLHGIHYTASRTPDALLRIPSESLTYITSFLDPPELLVLAQTCLRLNAHVTDDNTWRRAYAYQYLGINPEGDFDDDAAFMLRREEGSWRKEFIMRFKLRRRWEYSRNTTITHIPLHSTIATMHLMPRTTVLAASLQYGVVSRSYPLTGKVLRGFFDAAGTMNGLGIGNPNAEFSPHVSSIALSSEGGIAKILWGFRHGEVAVTVASRAMDHNRTSAARLIRCRPADTHDRAVESVAWASGSDGHVFFVSGGADGQIKLWEVTTSLKCLWTSNIGPSLVVDPCVKVAMDLQQGIIAAALRSGVILVWTGFVPLSVGPAGVVALDPRHIRVPAPVLSARTSTVSARDVIPQGVMDLRIIPHAKSPSLLLGYQPNSSLYRYWWNKTLDAFECVLLGDATDVPIRTIFPVWASRQDEQSFVITGDELGNIAMYHWGKIELGTAIVGPARRFAAHEDGAIIALGWNPAVLVSGTSQGTVKVWDALTFAPLRTFSSPSSRWVGGEWEGVGQILLERDTLVVSVGNRVLAWKAGPVGKSAGHRKGKGVRTTSGKGHNGVAKWQQQIEMYRDIAESFRELQEEQSFTRQVFGRQKEQLSTLADLGLSEAEAVEYMVMVSRDEEEARRRAVEQTSQYREDEGVFMADFDDLQTPMVTPASMSASERSNVSSRMDSVSESEPSPPTMRAQPWRPSQGATRTASSSSQVSPRSQQESIGAGFNATVSPSRTASSSSDVTHSVSDLDHFPVVAVSRTSSVSATSGSSAMDSTCSSPQSVRSAWSTPLRSLYPSEAPLPSRVSGSGVSSVSQSPARSWSGALTSSRRAAAMPYVDEDDEDLRYAIELSLAEARSKGENV